jgi:YHS domain-containing protein
MTLMQNQILKLARKPFGSAICAAATLLVLAVATPAPAQVNTGYFGNVAIEGYDTVAYFTDGKAVQGSEQYAYDWLGVSWHFASDEHRKLFAANPISYMPQFGGLCAEGVFYNEIQVDIEPEVWEIIDGKLYITAGAQFVEDMKAVRAKAEQNWPQVEAELTQ